MVLGLSVLGGPGLSVPMFAAVFISNVPEGLSSSAGWKRAGRGAGYVFGIWGAIALASGLAALAGFALLDGASPGTLAAVNALAAGAILADHRHHDPGRSPRARCTRDCWRRSASSPPSRCTRW